MAKPSNMYKDASTWNPFKGCEFDCVYCRPSFQRQARRQMHICDDCYSYKPHCHRDRLGKIPSAEIVFVAGNGDLSFCPPEFVDEILATINKRRPHRPQTYYLQSKRPECFQPFLARLPASVILVTTLETNRDEGYAQVSKAPPPSVRYQQFVALDYPRKVITVEPLMDFDEDVFPRWIIEAHPEYVWLGLNSRPKSVQLPEPSVDKIRRLVGALRAAEVPLKLKEMRGIVV